MSEPQATRGTRRAGWWWAGAAAAIAAAAIAARVYGLDDLGLAALAQRRADLAAAVAARPAAAALAYLAVYIAATAAALPGAALLTVAGGLLFGPYVGAALAVTGATAGACALFLAASTSLGRSLRARAGGRLTRLMEGFQRDQTSYLLVLRLAAVFPFWLVNLGAAAAGARLSTFAWTTLVGVAPGAFAFALAGAGLDRAIIALQRAEAACGAPGCAGRLSLSALLSRELLIAGALIGLLALAPMLWRRLRR